MEIGKKQKTSEFHRVRKPLNVSIDPENYKYLKNSPVNASRLVDNAINELRTLNLFNLVLISEKKEESWAWPDSNRRSSPCKGDVITS